MTSAPTRHGSLGSLGPLLTRASALFLLGAIVAACAPAPAATPAPNQAPPPAAKATEPAKAEAPKPAAPTTAAPAPAAKPAEQAAPKASPAVQPAAKADWQAEWDRVVAAAKREGTVVVLGGPGDTYRAALATAFERAYPDIKIQFTGGTGNTHATKVVQEHKAGQYLIDVGLFGPGSGITIVKPEGLMGSLHEAFILPEVADESKWLGGWTDAFADIDRKLLMNFEAKLQYNVWVNRDLVPESEISTIEQFADPKWKARSGWHDPRITGIGNGAVRYWTMAMGEDFVRRVLQNDPVITQDTRQVIDWVARGRYPFAVGVDDTIRAQYEKEGVWKNIKPLDPKSIGGARPSAGFGTISILNRAPHPNAARVYINWLLSREGQLSYSRITETNSRRVDVHVVEPDTFPDPTNKRPNPDYEEALPFRQKSVDIAREVLGTRM